MLEEEKIPLRRNQGDYETPGELRDRGEATAINPVQVRMDKNVKESLLSENKKSRKSWSQYYKQGTDMRESRMRWTILMLACSILFVV